MKKKTKKYLKNFYINKMNRLLITIEKENKPAVIYSFPFGDSEVGIKQAEKSAKNKIKKLFYELRGSPKKS